MWRMETLTVVVIVVAVGVAAALASVEVAPPARRGICEPARRRVDARRVGAGARRAARPVHVGRRVPPVYLIERAAVLGLKQLGAVAQQARQQSSASSAPSNRSSLAARPGARRDAHRAQSLGDGRQPRRAERSAVRASRPIARGRAEVTHALSQSAQALREAMASPTTRRQWGERMAEDVLRLAGYVETSATSSRPQLEGTAGRPDLPRSRCRRGTSCTWTQVPHGRVPRYPTPAPTPERQAQRPSFLRDVRACA